MAQQKPISRKNISLVDPIYQKFSKSVIRALGSTEFYEYFMDAVLYSGVYHWRGFLRGILRIS